MSCIISPMSRSWWAVAVAEVEAVVAASNADLAEAAEAAAAARESKIAAA